jgi:hypothetical protein
MKPNAAPYLTGAAYPILVLHVVQLLKDGPSG